MADNVQITAGSGTTLGTDDCAGTHIQLVKLVDGTADATGRIAGDATYGLDVDVTRLPSLPAGTANIGDVDIASIAAGDNNIGNVDVVTLPNTVIAGMASLPTGSNIIGQVDLHHGEAQTWIVQSTFVALGNGKVMLDLFNATGSGKVLRVHRIYAQKNLSAQTGVAVQFDLYWTTSVGTGGSALTPVSLDNTNTALPAQVTARSGATGGVGAGSTIVTRIYHSEETNVAAQMQEAFPFWPPAGWHMLPMQEITVRENQGLALKCSTNTTAGVYNVVFVFTVA